MSNSCKVSEGAKVERFDPVSLSQASDKTKDQRGFSLLEILIVLAIMGLIAALVAPRLFNQVDRSKQTVAETQIRSFSTALDTMRLDIGRYPSQSEGIDLLLNRSAAETEIRNWYGPYIEEIPADPWGVAYFYQPPERDQSGFETRPFIFTYGADQQRGGDGLDRDLGRLPTSDAG